MYSNCLNSMSGFWARYTVQNLGLFPAIAGNCPRLKWKTSYSTDNSVLLHLFPAALRDFFHSAPVRTCSVFMRIFGLFFRHTYYQVIYSKWQLAILINYAGVDSHCRESREHRKHDNKSTSLPFVYHLYCTTFNNL